VTTTSVLVSASDVPLRLREFLADRTFLRGAAKVIGTRARSGCARLQLPTHFSVFWRVIVGVILPRHAGH
jgi:hypothetical protein